MSATSRGAQRFVDDAYMTPPWCIQAILRELGTAPSRVLEPCAGSGAFVREIRAHWPQSHVSAVELNDERFGELQAAGAHASYQHDFLTWRPKHRFDLTITNPPFEIALQIIQRSLRISREVVMLLRINFLAGIERAAFFAKQPADVYVLPRRPSFVNSLKCAAKKSCGWRLSLPIGAERPKRCLGCGAKRSIGSSDATEYCFMRWAPGVSGKIHTLALDNAPASDS